MKALRRGPWLVLALVFLLPSSASAAEGPGAPAAPADERTGYAYFEVDGFLREALPPVYLLEFEQETLRTLIERIDNARRDREIGGLIVRVGDIAAGWGKVQEIRRALGWCRRDGKEVVCLLTGGGGLSYYLATGADRIVLQPAGHLMLVGLRAEVIFAKGLLDKIGVKAEFVQAGKYKTAGETFTREGPSPEFRESIESVLEDYYEQLVEGIAEGRDISASRAAALLRRGPFTAEGARELGLVDDVMFHDELIADLRKRHGDGLVVRRDYGRPGRPRAMQPGSLNFFNLLMGGKPERPRRRGPAIAVLYAVGPILKEDVDGFDLGAQAVRAPAFVKAIRRAARDRSVVGIILRVDSPGGSAEASDVIWRELRLADRRKPVVASLSDVAASGGYYIAAGARSIYAEPGCLTGSIGVFGGKLVLKGLLEKLGLNVMVIERGGPTEISSLFAEFSPRGRRRVGELIRATYRTFLNRVAATRPQMGLSDVEAVADGRVWTGRQAHRHGLVDALGGLNEAIDAVRQAAGVPPEQEVEIMVLPRPRNLIEAILFGGEEAANMPSPWGMTRLPEPLGELRPYLSVLLALQGEATLCLMPAFIRIR
ncbi:MAG: signal peptide peptidase SppA [Planctomycetota bacterium]|jgi:protease-4